MPNRKWPQTNHRIDFLILKWYKNTYNKMNSKMFFNEREVNLNILNTSYIK